uniref:ATP-dependent DNA helicase n=1 Tax=Setaria italica TaxID=4555 RepID=K3ZLQ2_SETIT
MTHRHCFESLDRNMRDILGFWWENLLLGGDFRQVLPVVEAGSRLDTIDASITNSYIWKHVKVKEFNDWVLSIGDGTAKGGAHSDDGDSEFVEIPHDILIPRLDSAIDDIIRSTYPSLETSYSDPTYLRERAIITPKNGTIDEINSRVLSLIPGHEKVYLSSDTLVESSKEHGNLDLLYPVKFLNSLQFKGIPPHKLVVKIGSPVMLLRNLNQSAGLCNGTCLIITQLGDQISEAQIITGSHIGDKVLLPRIALHVRVARMWQVSRTSKGRDFASMELVVVDEEGQGIMASIIDKALKKFSKSIVEGHCYCVRNFQVSKQERKFKAIPSTYTIFLTPWTIIEEIHAEVSASLPRFVDFDDLDHSRARHGQGLVDIIGQLAVSTRKRL